MTHSTTVFITGASSGIGAELAHQYAAKGAILGLVARRMDTLIALKNSLPNAEQHHVFNVDVTDHVALRQAAEQFIQATGGADIVIANAGISRGTLTEYSEDLAVIEKIMATNVVAMAATFSPFISNMKQRAKQSATSNTCRLVGIGSVAGIRGLPGGEAYSASKAAVISYCESLRVELRSSGIKVVTICPGYIDTPMTQANNFLMPFLMPVARFVEQAINKIDVGASYVIIPWQMGWVAKLLRLLPNFLFDSVFAKAPYKSRD